MRMRTLGNLRVFFFLRWGSGRTSAFPTCHKTWTVVHWWFFGVEFGGDWVFHLDVWEFGGFGIFTGIQAGGEFGASHTLVGGWMESL